MKKKVVSLAMGVLSLGLICSCSSDEDKGGSSGKITADQLKGTWVVTQVRSSKGEKYNYSYKNNTSATKVVTYESDRTVKSSLYSSGVWTLNSNTLTMDFESQSVNVALSSFSDEKASGTYEYTSNSGKYSEKGVCEVRKALNGEESLIGTIWKSGNNSIEFKEGHKVILTSSTGYTITSNWTFTGESIRIYLLNKSYIFFMGFDSNWQLILVNGNDIYCKK